MVLWQGEGAVVRRTDACGKDDEELEAVRAELRRDGGEAESDGGLRRYLGRWCSRELVDAANTAENLLVLTSLRRRGKWRLFDRVLWTHGLTGGCLTVLWWDVCVREERRLDALLEELDEAEDPMLVTRPIKDWWEGRSVLEYVKCVMVHYMLW